MTKIIDSAEAIKLLEKVRDEKGADYVYTDHYGTCDLARDGEPRCIVGHVYAALGIPIEELEHLYGSVGAEHHATVDDEGQIQFVHFEEQYGITFTRKARGILREVQYRQDKGDSWGNSVKIAVVEWAEAEEEL